jgi:hypothetical protein
MNAITWAAITFVGTVVTSVLVPFLSIIASQQLVRLDAKRQAAMSAFLKINKDMQNFRHAFLARHPTVLPLSSEELVIMTSKDAVDRLTRALLDEITELNGDKLMVGLIFGDEGQDLIQGLGALASRAALLLDEKSPPPPISECEQGLQTEVLAISRTMKPLWDDLLRRDLLAWRRPRLSPKQKALPANEAKPAALSNSQER